MPRDVVLRNYALRIQKGAVPVGPGENGEPVIETRWAFTFTDPHTGERVLWHCDDEARDQIVRVLTGGVVLAGGQFPKSSPRPPAA